MFSEQREHLLRALTAAGLSPDAATQIANILGNSQQELRHAGPVTHDTTPPDLRMVGPTQRKVRFPNLDFRAGDPDHRPQRVSPSEEKKEKEPDPNVVSDLPPQQVFGNFRIENGKLTDIVGTGQTAEVNVRHRVAGIPPAGLPLTLLDGQANQLVGKAPRAQVAQNDGTARLDIQETGREMVWNLQMLNREDYDVVTKIEFVKGKGLEVTYERIKAWNQNKERVDTIPTTEQAVVTEIVDDRKGLRGRRRLIPAFTSRGHTNTYFNTFRIGKFTGGWEIDTTKEVEQVWPESDRPTPLMVEVMNLTQTIADTDSEKYVLYAPRTKDKVPTTMVVEPESDAKFWHATHAETSLPPQYNVNGELIEKEPDGTVEPEVVYYAIEIENAQECNAFHLLNGRVAQDLDGFDGDIPKALSYQMDHERGYDPPCFVWRSHEVRVVTGVEVETDRIVFTRSRVWVLGEVEEDAFEIPLTDCPPPQYSWKCCVDGTFDPTITNEPACAMAGGTWTQDACSSPP